VKIGGSGSEAGPEQKVQDPKAKRAGVVLKWYSA
jgi:hypothetical protein